MTAPDVSTVKQALAGRWAEVFSSMGGCPAEILDGKNHPCPKCGGNDRFRLIDAEAGALFCNQCFSSGNGDGIAALQWLTGKSFPEVMRDLENYSGNGHSNGNGYANGKGAANSNGKKPTKSYATPEEVIETVYCSIGKRKGDWAYYDAGRKLVGQIVRFERPDGKKEYRPVSLVNGRWIAGGMPEPWPLYCLPDLADAQRVYVTEGEKAADAARSIGLTATTSPHGSKSAGKADWRPLAGKEIVILPDNDKPGRDYAEAVKTILAKLTPAPVVKVIELPGLPEAGDIVEWLDGKGDSAEPETMRAEIESLVAAAAVCDPPKPSGDCIVSYRALTCAELDAGNFDLEYLIDGILVAGQPCIIAGGQKTLKTSLLVDLGISLATGGHFLGRFPVTRPARVALMSGESGLGTLQETARRIAWAARRNLGEIDGLIWSEDLPRFGEPLHETALGEFIAFHRLEVLAIDPAYLAMPGCKPEDMFAQGGLLRGMSEVCRAANCLMILAHHNKKNRPDVNAPPELADIAWAGFSEFARQWLLVGRRQPYEPGSGLHRLWLSAGGSAGHNGLWALDVAEGTRATEGGRFWQVDVMPSDEARERAEGMKDAKRAERQEKQLEADRKAVVDCMTKTGQRETMRAIRDMAGIGNGQRFNRAWGSLTADGTVIHDGEITKANRQVYEAFRLRKGEQL